MNNLNSNRSNFGPTRQLEIYQNIYPSFPISYEDWEYRASKVLEKGAFDYAAGGAGAEDTMKANREAFYKWRIEPQILKDISYRDLSVLLFGQKYPFPVFLGPVGRQILFHSEGELASAKAAARLSVPFVLSTFSSYSIEDVSRVMGKSPRWFQLFWGTENEIALSMIKRAEVAGYSAIVISFDRPLIGWRERDLRNVYFPKMFSRALANFLQDPVFLSKLAKLPKQDIQTAVDLAFRISYNPGLTWTDFDWLRSQTKIPIVIKGITNPNDAELAVQHQADAIIVSNHGGRHLDGAVASLDALPKVSEVLRGRIPILLDSGIQRGADVIKAISLGAGAVLIGKLYTFALAVGGEEGVYSALENIIADTDLTMANAGISSLSKVDKSLVVHY